ncbi:MAG: hypothetical protein HOM21_04100, partial [Halobacteriovoraceae bacterium]|nr:hypothetical protein [Halobacteriovoraceae bacterium]
KGILNGGGGSPSQNSSFFGLGSGDKGVGSFEGQLYDGQLQTDEVSSFMSGPVLTKLSENAPSKGSLSLAIESLFDKNNPNPPQAVTYTKGGKTFLVTHTNGSVVVVELDEAQVAGSAAKKLVPKESVVIVAGQPRKRFAFAAKLNKIILTAEK